MLNIDLGWKIKTVCIFTLVIGGQKKIGLGEGHAGTAVVCYVVWDCCSMAVSPAEALRDLQKTSKIVGLSAGKYNETLYREEVFQNKSESIETTFFKNEYKLQNTLIYTACYFTVFQT